MNIVSVLGTRPELIKAAPVGRALRHAGHTEHLVHTGQHYDDAMVRVFFDELETPRPFASLGVGAASNAVQTARMLEGIEAILLSEQPDCVIVYGGTNSTLAGALAAAKLDLSIVHVEAGLRSFDRTMPEEHNRVIADHCADLLCCPTRSAVEQLAGEGLTRDVHFTGDTLHDAILHFLPIARERSDVLHRLKIEPKTYSLATVHRAHNTDHRDRLATIFEGLARVRPGIVMPVHPRTRRRMEEFDLRPPPGIRIIEPVGYLDMLVLEDFAARIFTDSGGVQREAYVLGVPCVTLRAGTEWMETVASGWNVLVDADADRIADAANAPPPSGERSEVFGTGDAAQRIVRLLGEMGR